MGTNRKGLWWRPLSTHATLPSCTASTGLDTSPGLGSANMLCVYALYSDFSSAKHGCVYCCFISIFTPEQCKTTSPRKKKNPFNYIFHHICLDPRDLLNTVLPPGNTGKGLLQSVPNSCCQGFAHVTEMLCKIKSSLTKISCKWTTILVSD